MKSQNIQQTIEREIMLRGYSRKTANAYTYQVKKFSEWFKQPIDTATTKDIQNYTLYLLKKKYKHSSIRLATESLKFYYTQILNKRRFHNLKPMKPNTPHRPIFTREEALTMINKTQNLKHKLLLMFIYGSGPRVSEVIKLKIKDIYQNEAIIQAGKGNKGRSIPVANQLKRILIQYLSKRKDTNPYLFHKGRSHITIRTVQAVVNQAKKRARVRKPGSCHALRRSFATHMKEMGANIYDIKEILGHSDIRTTFGYFSNSGKYSNLPSPLDSLH